MQKRGLSTIVVTLIVILVSLVAVGIIWVVVKNVIQTGSEGVGLGQFSLSAKIKDVSIDNSSNNVSLTVRRNAGKGDLIGINFIFSSNTDTEVITQDVSLNELEERKFNLHLNNISVSDLISVSIVPLIKQNEEETLGIILDKYNLGGSKESPLEQGCIPTSNPCGTWVCGNVLNGTCGEISCGNCTSGYNCVGGSCVFNFTGGNITGNFRYVRQGATGSNNGSDWTNAYTTLPATLLRNYTYYIADGSYGSYTFNDAVSGTQYITIKKAIESNHGTNTGWQASYGDGQAEFSTTTGDVLIVTSDYWIFDGQIGSGESNYGFKLSSLDTTTANKLFRISGAHSYISVSHTEFSCPGEDHEGLNQDGYYSADPTPNNLNISYCFFHDVTRNFITISSASNVIIEYCVFTRRHTTNNNPHGQGIQLGPGAVSNVTIRHSVHYDQYSTAFVCALDNIHSNINVYGNIFYLNDNGRYLVSNGVFSGTTGDTLNNCTFNNNVIHNIKGSSNPGIDAENGIDNYAYNNIWYDNKEVINYRGFIHDYNAFYNSGTQLETHLQNLQSDPFVNLAERDFHLSAPTQSGMTLPSPYNTDLVGNIRGADGVWDRGAYEYAGTPTGNFRYVRQGATGSNNGSDWTNAYTTLPATLLRNYTYYIADGNYSPYTFNDAVSGTQYITIKKAIELNHGTNTGWSSSYGDGQAIFSSTGVIWNIDTSYWIFDGQVGAGDGSSQSYGFMLNFTGTGDSVRSVDIDGSYITVKYADIKGSGYSGIDAAYRQDGVYVVGGTYTNVNISNNYIHDWKRCGIILSSGVHEIIVEKNLIARTYSTSAAHGQGIQIGASADSNYNLKIRYNKFYNVQGSGFIFYLGGSSSIHHDIDVYSNLFYADNPANWNTATAIGTNDDTTCNNCNVYGNTFYGLTGRSTSGYLELDHGYGTAKNNIFYQCNSGFSGTWTATHTASDDDYSSQSNFQLLTSNPFTNSAGGDFTLNSATNSGDNTIGSEYLLDILGNMHGAGGVWDRGAYEYI